jgi:hypothetical protein
LVLAILEKPDAAAVASMLCNAHTADSRQQTIDSRQQASDSRQQTAHSTQHTADSRQQTADSRQQTADSRQAPAAGQRDDPCHLGIFPELDLVFCESLCFKSVTPV